MAQIVETLTLEDKLTNTMTQCIQIAQRMANVMDDVRYSTLNVETATASTAQTMQDMASRMSQTNTQGASLLTTVRNLAGAFIGMQSIQWLVGTSDQLTQINARLQLMTGSAEAAAAANDQIYQAAMRARGSYTDMADLVSQLGTLAGSAFTDTGEIVAFAEQLQKQMALSGTSTQAAQAAMLQLTQGLSSGTLRGEELNSVLEQTPMIAQTIAEYMGVTTGEMRELASEGAVTADVVKNAILGAADETNATFAQMPMTWGQVWTMMQNMAIRALDPALSGISFLANNIEIIGPLVLGLGAAFAVFMAAANWVNITTAATTALTAAQTALSTVMATTWGPVLIIIIGIVTALYAIVGAINAVTGSSISATGLITGTVATALSFVGNLFIAAINVVIGAAVTIQNAVAEVANFVGNVFIDPANAIVRLMAGVADTVLGVLETIAGAIDTVFGSNLAGAVAGWRSDLSSWVNQSYGEQAVTIMEKVNLQDSLMDRFNYGDVFNSGYNAGANFNPFGGGSATGDLSQYTAGVSPYDEIAGTLDDISGSVKSIDKTVSMSDEDIKALVDVAERRYVNQVNLTSQTPVITINGANTGRTAQDRRALADAIEMILREGLASSGARSTAYA